MTPTPAASPSTSPRTPWSTDPRPPAGSASGRDAPHRPARLRRRVLGAVFVAAAAGNAVGTLPQATEVIEIFAGMSWGPGYEQLIRQLLVPVATPAVAALVTFEAAVGVGIWRGSRSALGLATLFVVGLIPALSWPYWSANVALGAFMGHTWLVLGRDQAERAVSR